MLILSVKLNTFHRFNLFKFCVKTKFVTAATIVKKRFQIYRLLFSKNINFKPTLSPTLLQKYKLLQKRNMSIYNCTQIQTITTQYTGKALL